MAARGPRALSSTDNTKTASRRISGEAAQASLLEAARELFYQEGVRAVGVEAVVERAGVNKMSLYRQFKSKDDLVLAYLARSAENFWGYFNASMDAHPDDARAAAAVLHRPVGAGEPGGLPGVSVRQRGGGVSRPVASRAAVCRAQQVAAAGAPARARRAAGAIDPDTLADDLAFLIEGAYTASQTFGAGAPRLMRSLPRTAATLLAAAIPARTAA